jgi:hypothetical protein
MKRRQAMEMVKEIMQGTGWTNPILGKTPICSPDFTVKKTGAQWKAEVKKKRQETLHQRMKPDNSDMNSL